MGIKDPILTLMPVLLASFVVLSMLYVHNYLITNQIETFFNESLVQDEKIRNKIFSFQTSFSAQNETQIPKLFILGSSHAHYLNTTLIQNNLSSVGIDLEVHNLSQSGDNPINRLESIDLIISQKPKIILYGIAYRDLQDNFNEWQNKEKSVLPSLDNYFSIIFEPIRNKIKTDFHENPKFVTLSMINDILKYDTNNLQKNEFMYEGEDGFIPYPNSYFKITAYTNTKTDEELKNHFLKHGIEIYGIGDIPELNKKVIALNHILDKFKQNDIQVLIFTTPHSKYYIDAFPQSEKQSYIKTLDYIESKNGIKIHDFYEKYKNLPIWHDLDHIALTENKIFGNDISQLIITELES